MTLRDVLNEDAPLDRDAALRLWHGAIRALRIELSYREYHSRLAVTSFGVDTTKISSGHPGVTVLDRDRIVSAVSMIAASAESEPWETAAPEQTVLVDGTLDQRTNVFNLGMVGYTLITGRLPHAAIMRDQLPNAIVRAFLEPIGDRSDARTAAIEDVIARAVEKDPSLRYPSLEELEADVAALLDGGTVLRDIIGRDSEIELVLRSISAVRDGEHRVVLVLGEPGVGKSFMWRSVERALGPRNEFRFAFKCSQITTVPYRLVGAILDSLLKAVDSATGHSIIEEFRVEPRLVATRVSREFARVDRDLETSGVEIASSGATVRAEIARLLARLLNEQSAAIVTIDDVQWLDDQSLAVLRELVSLAPPRFGLVLIGRPYTRERIGVFPVTTTIELTGFSFEQSGELLARLNPVRFNTKRNVPDKSPVDELFLYSQGNPLALLNLARRIENEHGELTGRPELSTHPEMNELLVSLTVARIERLAPETRELLKAVSILFPPVAESSVREVRLPVCNDADRLDRAVSEAATAFLITVNRTGEDPVFEFTHDTVELAIRRDAEQDLPLVNACVPVLLREVESGVDRAVFALARLIAPEKEPDDLAAPYRPVRITLDPEPERRALLAAAFRSAELIAPGEALRFSEAALERHERAYGDEDRFRLHEIAHEAAFLLGDVSRMSRHFLPIRACKDANRVNEARQLWISRAISSSSFAGALTIGRFTLSELGVILPDRPDKETEEAALRFLNRARFFLPARRLASRLARHGSTTDPRASLVIRVCVRLLFSVYVMRTDLFPIVIRTIIETSLKHGPLPQTGMAFLYWALLMAARTARRGPCFRMGRSARLFLRDVDELSRTTIVTATLFVTEHWRRDIRSVCREAKQVHFDAIRAGNIEWAGHAGHLYCVALLFSGLPLGDLYSELDEYRSRIARLGLTRTANAIGKYQQAAECLLGRTADHLELSGSLGHERTDIEAYERAGDNAALFGMYELRGMLAVFADRPDRGLADCTRAITYGDVTASIPDTPVTQFFLGLCAWREGSVEVGRRATTSMRIWTRDAPLNQEHRLFFLRAERARFRGHPAASARLYLRSIAVGADRGYIHEAALAAERLGDLFRETGKNGDAILAFHQAFGLFSRWGAVHAVQRIRTKLGWSESAPSINPVLLEQRFLQQLAHAETIDTVARIVLVEIARVSAASEAIIVLTRADRTDVYLLTDASRGGVERVDRVPGQWEFVFADPRDRPTWFHGQDGAPGVLCRATGAGSTTADALLVNDVGRLPFSRAVAVRSQSVLAVAVAAIELRRITSENVEAAEDLDEARRVVATTRDNQNALLGALSIGLVLRGPDGTVLVANEAAAAYLDDGSPQRLQSDLEAAVAFVVDRPTDERVRRTELLWEGKYLRLTVNLAPPFAAVSFEDITDARKHELELDRQKRQLILADRMASLGMLAASVAHEVGNPNHVLQLNLQTLILTLEHADSLGSVPSDAIERAISLAQQAYDASGRISEVIGGVKEYGRGGRSTEYVEADLNELSRSAVRFSRILASNFTDLFEFVPADEPLPVRVVPGLIEQAIVNLIKNSCEALPDRNRCVVIAPGRDADRSEVYVAVCDEGRGIVNTVGEAAGTAFVTGRPDDGGTGLGLSIVKTILDKHEGRLEFGSDDRFATIAWIRLPAAPT